MLTTLWKKRFKRNLLQAIGVFGYDVDKDSSGTGYTFQRRVVLGVDHLADVRTILGDKVHCVFDVGAHFGQTALQFADAFPRATVYSFEPDAHSYTRLCELARACPRIRPTNAAVGQRNGEATFFVNKFSQTNSLLKTSEVAREYLIYADQMDLQTTTTVNVLTLDGFCADHAIRSVDLLKIDTQGYELRVLEGAQGLLSGSAIPLIYLEVCFVPYYEDQPLFQHVYEYLYDRHYRLVGLYESGFRTHYYRVGGNALFVHETIGRRTDRQWSA